MFDLHVIRSTGEGTTYEDSISHLSESEREVTGLVFALAGYLVHDRRRTNQATPTLSGRTQKTLTRS
jgi:hypothetical protein